MEILRAVPIRAVMLPFAAGPRASQGIKVNARKTSPIVTIGSMTRLSGFFILVTLTPSRSGTTARLAAPATSWPMLSKTTPVAAISAVGRWPTAIPMSRIIKKGTETRNAAEYTRRKSFCTLPSSFLQNLTITLAGGRAGRADRERDW